MKIKTMKTFIVVQKSEEDDYLHKCDGTCINSFKCLCIKDLNTRRAGTAMASHGLQGCVLCERKARTYNILSYNYPRDMVVLNRQVLYDKKHFTKVNTNSIVQFQGFSPTSVDWYKLIFNTKQQPFNNDEWSLVFHVNTNCKYNILTNIEKGYSLGMKFVNYNLEQNKLKCGKCFESVSKITSSGNIVSYNSLDFTLCSICNCVVRYDDFKPFQICQDCRTVLNKKIEELQSTCFICHDKASTVHQTLSIIGSGRKKRKVVLCRFHSVDTDSSSMDEEKFNHLIHEHK